MTGSYESLSSNDPVVWTISRRSSDASCRALVGAPRVAAGLLLGVYTICQYIALLDYKEVDVKYHIGVIIPI